MPMKARYTVIDGEVIAQKRNGVRHLLVPDAQGSTVALVGSSSTITDTFEYWPYGEVRTRTGSTTMPFQYIGALGYYRDSTGRTYVRARMLRTDLGRWMTRDALWPLEATYQYARSSPVVWTDPSGQGAGLFVTIGAILLEGYCLYCAYLQYVGWEARRKELGNTDAERDFMVHCLGACNAVDKCPGCQSTTHFIFVCFGTEVEGTFDPNDILTNAKGIACGISVFGSGLVPRLLGYDCMSCCKIAWRLSSGPRAK